MRTPETLFEVAGQSNGRVMAVARSDRHAFSKAVSESITLLEGVGVQGDAHAGPTVQHRSRVAVDKEQPNLRQVHLLHAELFADLAAAGHTVGPCEMGENLTTIGLDLLALPVGTVLRVGRAAEVRLTGLRNPCWQIDRFQPGLLKQVLGVDDEGRTVRRAGVMSVVTRGGVVKTGDDITVVLPPFPHRQLRPV